MKASLFLSFTFTSIAHAWVSPFGKTPAQMDTKLSMSTSSSSIGAVHGENSCFLPLEQCDNEYYAPRILQIAGMYPGITKEELFAVTSTPAAEIGQWSYDFSDPTGPQLGTVALPGRHLVADCEDPCVVIAEHFSLGVPMPDAINEPVDILVVVDRAVKTFAERKFLVLEVPGEGVLIKAFNTKDEIPSGSEILGRVEFVQLPWLPCMQKKKSGFMEDDSVY